jgi:hypothetical protein
MDLNKSHWQKSCPNCSRKVGTVVFKPYPEAFGQSEKREHTRDNAQSWCTECRAEKRKAG